MYKFKTKERFTHMGAAIRRYRNRKGMMRYQLAEKSHVSVRYLQNIEHGRANPTLGILYQISVGLEMNLFEILSEYFTDEMASYIDMLPQKKCARRKGHGNRCSHCPVPRP